MSLITILIVILVVGGLVYLIRLLPIDQLWKTVAYVVLALFVAIWLLRQLKAAGFDIGL